MVVAPVAVSVWALEQAPEPMADVANACAPDAMICGIVAAAAGKVIALPATCTVPARLTVPEKFAAAAVKVPVVVGDADIITLPVPVITYWPRMPPVC